MRRGQDGLAAWWRHSRLSTAQAEAHALSVPLEQHRRVCHRCAIGTQVCALHAVRLPHPPACTPPMVGVSTQALHPHAGPRTVCSKAIQQSVLARAAQVCQQRISRLHTETARAHQQQLRVDEAHRQHLMDLSSNAPTPPAVPAALRTAAHSNLRERCSASFGKIATDRQGSVRSTSTECASTQQYPELPSDCMRRVCKHTKIEPGEALPAEVLCSARG